MSSIVGQYYTTWDKYTNRRLKKLDTDVGKLAAVLINYADYNGIKLRITSGFRSFAEQDALYAQGRTHTFPLAPVSVGDGADVTFIPTLRLDTRKIVTNARGGQSIHNFGRAFDVVELKNGRGLWRNRNWNTIGSFGKRYGFQWGGDWRSFKDYPHFQMK